MKKRQYKEKYIDLEFLLSIYEVDGRVNTSEYTGVSQRTKINGLVCIDCGKPYIACTDVFRKANFVQKCKTCQYIQTCINKYGVENISQSDEVKLKKIETTTKHYGVSNPKQSEIVKEQCRQTCIDRYGVDHYNKTEEGKEKHKQTCIDRYGVDHYNKTEEGKEKHKQTCMERYGVDAYTKTEEYKNKVKTTSQKRYGCDYYSQTEECKEKYKQTCLEKYGVPNFGMTLEAHKHRRTRIFYDNQWFDSKPELDYYKACLLANKKIIRHPIRLKYLYNNIVHYYFPDFLVDGQLVEIKGKHFINPETGKWWNPFDHFDDDKAAARYDCAIMNNVTIIYV